MTSVSLLATATVLPASRAAQVPASPAAPTMAVTTTSTSGSDAIAGDAFLAVQQTAVGREASGVEPAGGVGVGDGDPARPVLLGLAEEHFDVGMGAEADDLEAVGQVGDNVEAVGADGAGGAEHDQAARAGEPGCVSARRIAFGGGHNGIIPRPVRGRALWMAPKGGILRVLAL